MIILFVLIIGPVIGFILIRNKLQTCKQKIELSDLDMKSSLQRKREVTNRLVKVVKEYVEEDELDEIAEKEDLVEEYSAIRETLSKIKTFTYTFTDLKKDGKYRVLMENIKDNEKNIIKSKDNYNLSVELYNEEIEKFPGNIVSKIMGLNKINYLEFD